MELAAIAMDMWQSYINVVLKYYGVSFIVFVHYYVISNYNKILDELRRREVAVAPEVLRHIYKRTGYLLLKGREKIEDDSQAKARLERLLSLNRNLNIAYILKEAESSGIQLLKKFANPLVVHRAGILNYFNHFITTGKVEGLNNKIGVLKRQAYGYRDRKYFKLRLYFLHETTYSLVGMNQLSKGGGDIITLLLR